jgi:hypothetical protein
MRNSSNIISTQNSPTDSNSQITNSSHTLQHESTSSSKQAEKTSIYHTNSLRQDLETETYGNF